MTLGEEWYHGFWDDFQAYVSDHPLQWKGTTTDEKWSAFMFSFLTDLAGKLGFQEEAEERAFRTKRFDRVWRRAGDTVILEHENWGVKAALDDEVPKLAERKGDLHVCVTYVPAAGFPGDEHAEKCRHVLDEEQFEGEFLLVLGTYEMRNATDWVCHRIMSETSLHVGKIILPSSVSASTWAPHGRHKSDGTQRESGWDIMKRQMPTSKAVQTRLERAIKAHRGENYIRSLKSLKHYWEVRGK